MKKSFLAVLLLSCFNLFGASNDSLQYRGQEEDQFTLNLTKSVTLYRTEYRDSTCTRQVPYTSEECSNETRYRQQCRWQAGQNICRTEYDRQCRTVTRHRRECSRQPGRRVCRNSEPQRICRNGRCFTEPSRRICENKPGREVCRQVPYQDRQCDSVPRRVCDREPGRNVCSQVPYQEYVCRNVTQYRSETYACQQPVQIPYTVDKEVVSDVVVRYQDKTDQASAKLNFQLLDNGQVTVKAIDTSDLPTFIRVQKSEQVNNQDGDISSQVEFQIKFIDQKKTISPVTKGISSVGLSPNSLWFSLGKVHQPKRLEIKATIVRDGLFSSAKVLFNKILNAEDLNISHHDGSSRIKIDLSKYGVELKKRKHEITIEAKVILEDAIVNQPRNGLSTSHSVEIKAE